MGFRRLFSSRSVNRSNSNDEDMSSLSSDTACEAVSLDNGQIFIVEDATEAGSRAEAFMALGNLDPKRCCQWGGCPGGYP